ncbi:stemmadenine O-acetyltransferase-like [Rhodamnia argentea]|uniref:Stemmadenine O-acetyltransferase-like n=1 Tax=Rhodamnia argentea TaxID=178133 RepID=A0A8B8NYU1_9MYRT|nr:stemmadenine O-acetyltransferase-like [Rhodamnia argentea]
MKVILEHAETIKPSSPTPPDLRRHSLSFLDQIAPPIFMPLLLFFSKDDPLTNEEKLSKIKRSLSETLTGFYPLAGRLRDNLYVECNDDGVHFVVAQATCRLSEVLESPDPEKLDRLLPFKLYDLGDLATAVQVSFFECGGLCLALCVSHKLADALSFFSFLNSWATVARGDGGQIISPVFESSSLFPPMNLAGFAPSTGILKEGLVTKRFVFDAVSIAALRDKYCNNEKVEAEGQIRRPTRVEALSAFLWRRYMESTQKKPDCTSENDKIYTVLHAVNLRPRMDPPLSDRHFGNISRIALAMPTIDTDEHMIVNQVREAIKEVNTDYVKKLREGEGHLNFMKERSARISKGEIVPFSFTSLCRFPTYEADFGWGKPAWVGSSALPYWNLVSFLDTRDGGGIEAYANLKPEDMALFEKDKELLSLASSSAPPNVKYA